MTDEIKHLRNQLKIISKDNEKLTFENQELKIHDTFLVQRLDRWADKNFDLRLKIRDLEQELQSLKPNFLKENDNAGSSQEKN